MNDRYRGARFPPVDQDRLDTVLGAGFYNAFEYAAVGMVVVDLEGRCLAANRALCQILECDLSELLGEGFHSFTHPDDIPENLRLGELLITGQVGSFQLEKRYIRKSGRTVWVLLSASLVRDAHGAVVCVISQVQDIDSLKSTEAALRESEERYRGIVEDQTETVCRFLPDTTLLFVNDAYCRYFGKTREELIGHSLLDHSPPALHAELIAHFAELVHTTGTSRNEHPTIAAGGEQRWQEWTNRALCDAQGKVIAIQSVGRDITDRIAAEAAEREQRDLAEALRDSAAALNSTLEFDTVLDRILANADRVVAHDASNVMLIDRATNEAYIVRQRGYTERGQGEWIKQIRLSLSLHSDFQLMIQTGMPLVIPDITKYPAWISLPGSSWLRSYAAAPIMIKGQTIGFLNFDSATPGFFNNAHIKRLQIFADQAAVAIENARLFESSRHKEVHLIQLHEAGMALAQADSVSALYQTIVRWTYTLASVNMVALMVYDQVSHLVIVEAVGFGVDTTGSRIALGEGLSGVAAQTRQPQQTQRYEDFPGRIPFYRDRGVSSAAAWPLIWQGRLIGVIGTGDPRPVIFNEDDMHFMGLYASLVAAAIDQRRAMGEATAREAEANALSVRLANAQEEERLRIAGELHDTIGFRLVELQKNTEIALAAINPDNPNAKRMQDALELLRETQRITQSLSVDLSSRALSDLGLSAAIRQYIDRLKETTGANIHLHVVGRIKRLPDLIERVTYRGLQEAIINALRHAQADRINIRIHFGPKRINLTVEDNGHGFDNESQHGSKGTLLGLPELRRQVEALQGDFSIHTALGQGTQLEIGLPFNPVDSQSQGAKTRVVLADHQEITRRGLHMLLAQDEDFTCVGEADDGLKAVHLVELHRPDIVIVDIDLPNVSGAEVAHQISKRFPQVSILILASKGDEALLRSAFNAGVRGYLLKSDQGQVILKGLRLVRDGEICVSPALMELWHEMQSNLSAGDPLQALTLREREVFQLILAGNTNRKIGEQLGISYRTVEVHRRNTMAKLKVRSLAQLMQYATVKLDDKTAN